MDRNQIIANGAIIGISIVFLALIMWLVPERALDLIITNTVTISLIIILLWRTKIDQRKDERTIHLIGLGARNAFIFLLFAMPWLASFNILGIIIIDAYAALMMLWIVSLSIAWISFFYYYTR